MKNKIMLNISLLSCLNAEAMDQAIEDETALGEKKDQYQYTLEEIDSLEIKNYEKYFEKAKFYYRTGDNSLVKYYLICCKDELERLGKPFPENQIIEAVKMLRYMDLENDSDPYKTKIIIKQNNTLPHAYTEAASKDQNFSNNFVKGIIKLVKVINTFENPNDGDKDALKDIMNQLNLLKNDFQPFEFFNILQHFRSQLGINVIFLVNFDEEDEYSCSRYLSSGIINSGLKYMGDLITVFSDVVNSEVSEFHEWKKLLLLRDLALRIALFGMEFADK